MIQDKSVNQEQGFTMLEIVTVLVLLGVIATVAVPKYFDMQEQAELKAARAAVDEAQVRINTLFSKKVYQGMECEDALKQVNKLELIADQGGLFNRHVLEGKDIVPEGTDVVVSTENGNYSFTSVQLDRKLYLPRCSAREDIIKPDDEVGCTFTLFGKQYTCFDEKFECPLSSSGWATGNLMYGTPIRTKNDGIYIVKTTQYCPKVYEAIENPRAVDFIVKLRDEVSEDRHKKDKNGTEVWDPKVFGGDYLKSTSDDIVYVSTEDIDIGKVPSSDDRWKPLRSCEVLVWGGVTYNGKCTITK